VTAPPLEQFYDDLRQNYRVKRNCDYAVSHKYGQTFLLCQRVYKETILEVAAQHGIKFSQVFEFDYDFSRNVS
jgi:hypothetical protein